MKKLLQIPVFKFLTISVYSTILIAISPTFFLYDINHFMFALMGAVVLLGFQAVLRLHFAQFIAARSDHAEEFNKATIEILANHNRADLIAEIMSRLTDDPDLLRMIKAAGKMRAR